MESFNILKAIFLIILSISGNFVLETLGCQTQYYLNNNIYAKHYVLILVIYFTLGFVGDDKPVHPMVNAKFTLLIWALYLLFTNMDLQFTIIAFNLLTINYIIHTYIIYYKSLNQNDKLKPFQKAYDLINRLLIFISIIGGIAYFQRQYKDHSDDWSISKFILGTIPCDKK